MFDYDPQTRVVYDEIVVSLSDSREWFSKGEGVGGKRGEKFKYTYIYYDGIFIENLTNPDRKLEYE